MDVGLLLMAVGLVIIILSFFLKDPSKKVAKDVENLSMSIYQETNQLNKRIKALEEEMMVDTAVAFKKSMTPPVTAAKKAYAPQATKHINPIILSQVLALNKQGLSITEIGTRSNLSEAEVIAVITEHGGKAV